MKALTICQPYAHLFLLSEDDPRRKRVENRTWYTAYRGLMYLHAGKSREWLDVEDGIDMAYNLPLKSMAFGAVVAIAKLVDCLHIDKIHRGEYRDKYPWLEEHQHTNGPWCWIYDRVNAIGPWPWRGAQGLFDIDSDELNRVANRELDIPEPSLGGRS